MAMEAVHSVARPAAVFIAGLILGCCLTTQRGHHYSPLSPVSSSSPSDARSPLDYIPLASTSVPGEDQQQGAWPPNNETGASYHAGRAVPEGEGYSCLANGREATCLFRRACLRVQDMTIVLPPGQPLPDYDVHAGASPGHRLLRFESADGRYEPSSFRPGVWALSLRYHLENRGHVLGDEVWPVWQALGLWGMEAQASDVHVLTDKLTPALNQYEVLTSHAPTALDELVTGGGGGDKDVVCFDTLLAGTAQLGYALGTTCRGSPARSLDCRPEYLPDFKSTFRRFRRHVMRHLGVGEPALPRNAPRIVVLQKDLDHADHPFTLLHLPESLRALEGAFPHADVRTATWTKMSLREQVELLAGTDVLISLPGSDMMAAAWLPPTAEIVQVCRITEGEMERGNEQQIWYQFSHHIQYWCDGLHLGKRGVALLPHEELVRRVRQAVDRLVEDGAVRRRAGW